VERVDRGQQAAVERVEFLIKPHEPFLLMQL
jgi:hypothetical protein